MAFTDDRPRTVAPRAHPARPGSPGPGWTTPHHLVRGPCRAIGDIDCAPGPMPHLRADENAAPHREIGPRRAVTSSTNDLQPTDRRPT